MWRIFSSDENIKEQVDICNESAYIRTPNRKSNISPKELLALAPNVKKIDLYKKFLCKQRRLWFLNVTAFFPAPYTLKYLKDLLGENQFYELETTDFISSTKFFMNQNCFHKGNCFYD